MVEFAMKRERENSIEKEEMQSNIKTIKYFSEQLPTQRARIRNTANIGTAKYAEYYNWIIIIQ